MPNICEIEKRGYQGGKTKISEEKWDLHSLPVLPDYDNTIAVYRVKKLPYFVANYHTGKNFKYKYIWGNRNTSFFRRCVAGMIEHAVRCSDNFNHKKVIIC